MRLDKLADHGAVKRYVNEGSQSYLCVRPYGNAALLNKLARSNEVQMGNVAVNDDGTLRVHVS